ncbi:MAG: beta-lactamase family protein [Myxococcaceae bacterium]|jgi:D-alanyl-D-alanine carboxypeptidase|nr:beta-lactamase family protein [Myxococcaceae bacterium]
MTYIRRGLIGLAVLGGVVGVLVALQARPLSRDEAAAHLDEALREAVETDDLVHGGVMWVDAPGLGLQQGWAHGLADVDAGTPMTLETPFLSASVGKLFVATAVLALERRGALSLEDPLSKWTRPEAITGLPIVGGDEALAKVTVRQLLAHRTGLPDAFSDASSDGEPRLFDRIALEPNRRWSRDDVFAYTRAHYPAVGAPGSVFHYSDLNYDLLGLVLEGVTGRPFHEVVRREVLEPLALTHTWYHAYEPAPAGVLPIADVFVGRVNLRGAPALSVDQAGGGLATTVEDLRRLLRGLLAGRPVPLNALATSFTEDAMHPGIDVGLCAWRIRPGGVFFALGGLPVLEGHSGATGVWAYAARDLDAVLVGAVSQSSWQEAHVKFLLAEVLPVLSRVRSR